MKLTFNPMNGVVICQQLNKDIFLEETSLSGAIREDHNSKAVLDAALAPLASIDAAICPVHLTIAILHIVRIMTFVVATTGPSKLAKTVFHVLMILTFVGVCDFIAA